MIGIRKDRTSQLRNESVGINALLRWNPEKRKFTIQSGPEKSITFHAFLVVERSRNNQKATHNKRIE